MKEVLRTSQSEVGSEGEGENGRFNEMSDIVDTS